MVFGKRNKKGKQVKWKDWILMSLIIICLWLALKNNHNGNIIDSLEKSYSILKINDRKHLAESERYKKRYDIQ